MWAIYWLITETEKAWKGEDQQKRHAIANIWGTGALLAIVVAAYLWS